MIRPSATSRVFLAASTTLGATAFLLPGCNTSPPPTRTQSALGRTPVAVDPSWRRFAEEHFRGMVLAEVGAQPDLRFVTAPDISAFRRHDNGQIELTAIGEADVNDATGTRYRRPFYVTWVQTSRGWEPLATAFQPGKLSPEPLRAPPTTTPITATPGPVKPPDPNTAPPPPNPATPLPTASRTSRDH
jgi:hypothetical protein